MRTSDAVKAIAAMVVATAGTAIFTGVVGLVLSGWPDSKVVLQAIRYVPLVFAVALPHAAVGLLAYFLLRLWFRASWWACVTAGFLIGALPLSLYMFDPGVGTSWENDILTSVDGRRTFAGWLSYLRNSALFGLPGAVAGLIFWLGIRSSPALVNRKASTGESPSQRRVFLPLISAAGVSALLLSIPSIMLDRSCHNPMRDGRTSIGSELRIRIDLKVSEWPDLKTIFKEFGADRGWSMRDDTEIERVRFPYLSLDACDEAGTKISALAMVTSTPADDYVPINVYQPQGGDSWKEPATAFVQRLSERWPGRVRFNDERGTEIPPPEWIAPALKE